MKKFFIIITASLLSLTSCNKTASTTDSASNQEAVASNIQELNDEKFVELVGKPESDGKHWHFASDKPIVIDFYATWCGPCKKMAPNMERLAKEYEGSITVYKVNVDNAKQTAGMFGVNRIPSIMIVNPAKGQLYMQSGYKDYEGLKDYIKETLE